MTQAELAWAAGIRQQAVSRLERAASELAYMSPAECGLSFNPTLETLLRVALALECAPSDLLAESRIQAG